MNNENQPTSGTQNNQSQGFLITFLKGLARDAFRLVIAFAVGTGGGAIVCWYYGLPLILSIGGGILVLGLALALTTDSWFS